VSLALRGFLARQGFGERELACDPLPDAALPPWLARRTIALSLGSWQLLSRIAAPPPSAPILTVDVSLQQASGRTRLTAGELGVPALGHVVRYDALHDSLVRALARGPAASASPTVRAVPITVLADGNPGDDSSERDFEQSAVLATVRAGTPRDGFAFERFTSEGPLALLPLPQARSWSLVWCSAPDRAQQRAQLQAPEFATALRAAFGPALGSFELLDAPIVAPLHRRLRRRIVQGNEVAIGNAAQALHPVAGQGLNLGLRDAFVLAEMLGAARAGGAPLQQALAGFERARRADRLGTVAVTDTLASIFGITPLRPLQSLALNLLEIAPPARRALARAFMFGPRS
ncbi:MAG TPA: FAD-dependent monooxygenase, partial [Burkholderiaceae bacterium]|nr:FAD-dependent monooxygenase [Burkholderiaceae bacterium]